MPAKPVPAKEGRRVKRAHNRPAMTLAMSSVAPVASVYTLNVDLIAAIGAV